MSSLFYMARRFKTATALNLIGLTVAFAAFYLFMMQIGIGEPLLEMKTRPTMEGWEWAFIRVAPASTAFFTRFTTTCCRSTGPVCKTMPSIPSMSHEDG